MQCTLSLPWLPGLRCPGVGAPDRILSMVQIELRFVLMSNFMA